MSARTTTGTAQRASVATRRLLIGIAIAFLAGIGFQALFVGGHSASGRAGRSAESPLADTGAAARSTGEGPARVEHGVPAGFTDDRRGAVAAAAAFVCTGQTLLDMDPLAAEEAVRQMAASATADNQVTPTLDGLQAVRSQLASGVGPITFRQAALAWRVESLAPGRARVAVWNVGILARERVASPQAGWAISTFDLVWERSDWRIETETIVPGPAPVLNDSTAPATAGQFAGALGGFSDFGGAL